jgi:hypothetical protein
MGTWVDEGVGHTHFLNGAHLLALICNSWFMLSHFTNPDVISNK